MNFKEEGSAVVDFVYKYLFDSTFYINIILTARNE